MESSLPDSNSPEPAEQQPTVISTKSPINRTSLLILILLLCFAAALIYFKLLPNRELKPTPTGTTNQQMKTLSGLEVAQKTAGFLDKTVKPDGSFQLSFDCGYIPQPNCTPKDKSTLPFVGEAILAYLDLYKKTGDNSYKQKADRATDYYFRRCEQSSDACLWAGFAFLPYFKDSGQERYKNAIVSSFEKGIEPGKPLMTYLNLTAGHRLAILYELTQDKKYADQLDNIAKEVLAGKLNSEKGNEIIANTSLRKQDVKILWDIYLPAYKVTKNDNYLYGAQDLLKKMNLSDNFDQVFRNYNLLSTLRIMEALLDVSEISKSDGAEYKKDAYEAGQKLVLLQWDTPENKKYNGDYGFLSNVIATQTNSKETYDSGLAIRLFLRMGDQSFNMQY